MRIRRIRKRKPTKCLQWKPKETNLSSCKSNKDQNYHRSLNATPNRFSRKDNRRLNKFNNRSLWIHKQPKSLALLQFRPQMAITLSAKLNLPSSLTRVSRTWFLCPRREHLIRLKEVLMTSSVTEINIKYPLKNLKLRRTGIVNKSLKRTAQERIKSMALLKTQPTRLNRISQTTIAICKDNEIFNKLISW